MRILQQDTAALLIDIQDKLVPVINNAEQTVAASARLIKGLQILQVPIIPVRQYPKGLGDLTPEIREALGEHLPSDKATFSAWENADVVQRVQSLGKKNILVFGMETHICVLQTVIDLLAADFNVVLIADCASSRREEDHQLGLRRAEQEGALITSSESILFELLRAAGTDTFKQISALVK